MKKPIWRRWKERLLTELGLAIGQGMVQAQAQHANKTHSHLIQ